MAALRVASFLAPRLESAYRAVAAEVAGALGRTLAFRPAERPEDLLEAGSLDAAFLCGLPYVGLRDRGGEVEALGAPIHAGGRYGGRPVYFADAVVRHDDRAADLEGLRGRRLAFNEEGSHSGWVALLAHLERTGVERPLFGGRVRSGGHVRSVEAVRDGLADAATIDSQVLDLLRRDDAGIDRDLRTVTTIGPWPAPPLVAGARLSGADRRRARSALARLADSPAGPVLASHLVEGWVAVADADYDPIRAARDLARRRGEP